MEPKIKKEICEHRLIASFYILNGNQMHLPGKHGAIHEVFCIKCLKTKAFFNNTEIWYNNPKHIFLYNKALEKKLPFIVFGIKELQKSEYEFMIADYVFEEDVHDYVITLLTNLRFFDRTKVCAIKLNEAAGVFEGHRGKIIINREYECSDKPEARRV